ncbi:endonuclease/exonuclease/phosphatase family protein [Paenibacillus filicis]|uniref:Endonuclease/exonuclease/phosphatase family protein n=1 Tax=Paenibacillus gyeongsangnamensis TaxID=3388067 RepID=A0ABT4QHP8_9BACL|nr:endonuclease/exonuclease/phosphatase family protein [Paenibacillus filicis]MCZ8516261.1 endonuclease/exonuclease/phosphatase family protein [Paenibacillus filicis]
MTTIRVMTYNMLHAPGDRLEELAQVIQETQPDILACQEVDDIDGLMTLAQRSRMLPVIGHCNMPESEPAPEHVAILSRYPINRLVVHPCDTEAMFRPIFEVWIQPPNHQPIGFFTLHYRALPGPAGSNFKMREVGAMMEVLKQIEGPHCVLGDFNAWAPGEGDLSPTWGAQLPDDHRDAVRGPIVQQILDGGYVDTWRKANPSPDEPIGTLRGRNSRVDFIFADSIMASYAKESRIIRNPLTERASDHYPVLTIFEI